MKLPFISAKTNPYFHPQLLGTVHPHTFLNTFPLAEKEQGYHGMIIGTTGSGKSEFIRGQFTQHVTHNIKKNVKCGAAIIDPHHDLAYASLIGLIHAGYYKREDIYERVIYIDWGNGGYTPFNILAGNSKSPHDIALDAFDGMTRVWPSLKEAEMCREYFVSAAYTLILNNLPLTYMLDLLLDRTFRNRMLQQVPDRAVHQTFLAYDDMKLNEQMAATGSLRRRIHHIAFHPIAQYSLGQPECLDLRAIMDQGYSLIINLGNVSNSDTRRLLGAMLMVQLEQAALSRSDILLQSQRAPFTVYVDEWPSFAAQDDTIGTILSQTRKFNLRLHLACQSLAQISSGRLVEAIENCKMLVTFAVGSKSADVQAKEIGTVDPYAVKEEGLTDTQHAQYLSITEQINEFAQELRDQDDRMAYVKLGRKPAFQVKTLTLKKPEPDAEDIEEVLTMYRKIYQRTQSQARKVIDQMSERVGIVPGSSVAKFPESAMLPWSDS